MRIARLQEDVHISVYDLTKKMNEVINAVNHLQARADAIEAEFSGHTHHARELQFGTYEPTKKSP